MSKIKVDVAVLGAGPGGYPAAIRAAQGGKKVAIIEAELLGGTCLNWGCIPTKALLMTSDCIFHMKKVDKLGVSVGSVTVDWEKAIKRKNSIVEKLRSGLSSLIASNGIDVVRGWGKLTSPHHIEVVGANECTVEAEHIILATGSCVKDIPTVPFDGDIVHNSSSILDLTAIPESIAILGAGAIGCEFASLFSALGSKVTLIEALSRILPNECAIATQAIAKSFDKRGLEVICGQKVVSCTKDTHRGRLTLEDGRTIEAQKVLVAVGRGLNTSKIGLVEVGINMHKGAIVTNDRMMTNIDSIYAVGDCTAKSMLAHVATHQGLVAAENILGNHLSMSYNAIPGVVFTIPEYASVGLNFEEAKKQGYQATLGTLPFQALGKAVASSEEDGFCQVVLEKQTGRILGAQIVGERAGDLIAEISLAITNELTGECITHAIHAHPTYSECWGEAVLIAEGMPLSFPKTLLNSVLRG